MMSSAAEIQWNAVDGNWDVDANWVGNVKPGAGDRALINRAGGGTAHVTTDVVDPLGIVVSAGNVLSVEPGAAVVLPDNQDTATTGIRIGDGAAGTANVSGGELKTARTGPAGPDPVNYISVGRNGGSGTLNLSDTGAIDGWRMYLGEGAGSTATVSITGGAADFDNDIFVGNGGNATLTQSGGTLAHGGWGYVGRLAGSVGQYNLTGGVYNPRGQLNVGQDTGTGTFQQDGGTVNIGEAIHVGRGGGTGTYNLTAGDFNVGTGAIAEKDLIVGADPGTNGTFNMTGGTVSVGRWGFVGRNGGSGVVNQNTGTVSTTGWIRIAESTGAVGVYNLSGTGVVNVGDGPSGPDLGDNDFLMGVGALADGTFNMQDNTVLNATRDIRMGVDGGVGKYNQSGGDANVAGAVFIGQNPSAGGVIGTGVMDLSGGTFDVGIDVNLGEAAESDGTLNVSGTAAVTVAENIVVGRGGAGVVNQSGGTLTTATLSTRLEETATGDYNLAGGTLNAGAIVNNGTFDYTGGTANVGTISGTGTTTVGSSLNLAVDHIRQETANVDGTVTVRPNSTETGVSRINTITLGSAGKIDLTDNKLITPMPVGTWTGTAYDGVAGMVDTARGNAGTPTWNGPNGITTSDARAQGSNLVSIGVAKAGDIKGIADTDTATFAGQTVLGSDTIAMVTYGGDATLDGKINIDDYGRIDANVAQSGSVFGWYNGDFNYDGAINIDDYGIIDGNISNQGDAFPTAGSVDGVSAVPEPATFSLLVAAGAALAARRRRR